LDKEAKYESILAEIMFRPTRVWVDLSLKNLVNAWGFFPTLSAEEVLRHLGAHTYNLRAAQKAIEHHLWGKDVDADVSVHFVHLPVPGRIKSYQFWEMGRLHLKMEIEVSEKYRHNPVDQMNILAHEYAHAFHFLRHDFIAPKDTMEYEHLTDLSTIALGMGSLTLQGRGANVDAYGITTYIGYMPLDLLEYAHARYRALEGKVPLASERPATTIRPGSDKKWDYEEPVPMPSELTSPDPTRPGLNAHWTESDLIATIPQSNTVVPLNSDDTIGRSFVNTHFKGSSNVNRVSREQLLLTLKGKSLCIKNTGKHPVKIHGSVRSKFWGLFNVNQKKQWTLVHGEEVTLSQPPVIVTMPDESSFSIGKT
jgi:hypothetical protein